jgi:hypothetical protein
MLVGVEDKALSTVRQNTENWQAGHVSVLTSLPPN